MKIDRMAGGSREDLNAYILPVRNFYQGLWYGQIYGLDGSHWQQDSGKDDIDLRSKSGD